MIGKMKKKQLNKKGFTLIEIIVVVVILAVLMSVAVPSVMQYLDKADEARYLSYSRGAIQMFETELIKASTKNGGIITIKEAKDIEHNIILEEMNKNKTDQYLEIYGIKIFTVDNVGFDDDGPNSKTPSGDPVDRYNETFNIDDIQLYIIAYTNTKKGNHYHVYYYPKQQRMEFKG